MHRAMFFGLNDRDPDSAGDARAETRASDPAADDYDVEISHVDRGYELERPGV